MSTFVLTDLSKDLWVEAGWGARVVPAEQLYDLVLDPQEGDNRAADPACAEALDEMRGRLGRWMEETRDPLLSGPIEPPPGAIVNEQWQVSPDDPARTIAASPAPAQSG